MAMCVVEVPVRSFDTVQQHLQANAFGLRPDDADGSVAFAAAELYRRASRLAELGYAVRVSASVDALRTSSVAHQEGWG